MFIAHVVFALTLALVATVAIVSQAGAEMVRAQAEAEGRSLLHLVSEVYLNCLFFTWPFSAVFALVKF